MEKIYHGSGLLWLWLYLLYETTKLWIGRNATKMTDGIFTFSSDLQVASTDCQLHWRTFVGHSAAYCITHRPAPLNQPRQPRL